jgi:antirestriction protein ArdC
MQAEQTTPHQQEQQQPIEPAPKADIYAKVTSLIVDALERGTLPWRKPWDAEHAAGRIERPLRHSGEPYRGINVLMLWITAEMKGYTSPLWLTFNQAKEEGGNVRKGEKGTPVVYASKFDKEVETDAGKETQEFFCYRQYSAFNAEQCENLPERFTALRTSRPKGEPVTVQAEAESFFRHTGADIRHGGTKAYYSASGNYVQMPHVQTFTDGLGYCSTLAHELVHWTKHETRLDRDTKRKAWGDEGYAMEELVAEIGSAFLCADLGLPPTVDDNAAYVAAWLKVLQGDKRAIFTAAAMSEKAVGYLHEKQPGTPATGAGEVNHGE